MKRWVVEPPLQQRYFKKKIDLLFSLFLCKNKRIIWLFMQIKSIEVDKSFNEKLNLWKGKDKLATMESYRNRGLKRKVKRKENHSSTWK